MFSVTTPYWAAVQVRANHEFGVAKHLAVRGCEYFLPATHSIRQWSDRKKELCRPLFPGYLFCRYAPEWRHAILSAPGVVRIVGWCGEPEPVDEHEVEAIRRI